MNRPLEEYEGDHDILSEERWPYPPLNLHCTVTPEFINSIETVLQRSTHQQQNSHSMDNNIRPPETPKNAEKQKPMSCQISKITIGQWTHIGAYPDDLKAKFYFAKRKLMWEILDDVETRTQVARLKKKIEIRWTDVLSFRATFNPCDETGTLEVELKNRPMFFMETNTQAKKHTQWKDMEDFTLDQSASTCRIHTLHFLPGDLQKILDKLVSGDRFWSELAKKRFPTRPHSLHFDIGYGNSNNNDGYGHCQTLSFDINYDLLHHHIPQGHVPLEELNFNMANQFSWNDGNQMNSFVQNNHQIDIMSQLPVPQVTYPSYLYFDIGNGNINNNDISNSYGYGHCQTLSFDVNNDLLHHRIPQESGHAPLKGFNFNMTNQFSGNDGSQMNSFVQHNHQIDIMSQLPVAQVTGPSSQMYISGSHFNHPMIQDERHRRNTGELRGSQAYAQETQTDPIRFQHTYVLPEYQIGPYLLNLIAQEEERQNMNHIYLDGNFQTNSVYNYDQCFSSEPPDLL